MAQYKITQDLFELIDRKGILDDDLEWYTQDFNEECCYLIIKKDTLRFKRIAELMKIVKIEMLEVDKETIKLWISEKK